MANEQKKVYGTTVTLEANGAAIANGAIGQADDIASPSINNSTAGDYPHMEFVLSGIYAVAPTADTVIEVLAREIDIDGTNDADAPTAIFRKKFLTSLQVQAVTTLQFLKAVAYDVPRKFDVYLYNDTGQSLPAGWTLKATPFTFGPT